MKRRIIVTVLALVLAMSVAVYASAEQITAGSTGFTNVPFSNGYYGFCIDRYLSGAYSGDSFNVADDTSAAKSNADGSDISQKLKVLFTQCFDTLFLSDGNGGYVIDSNKADGDLAYAIYHFTGEQSYIWGSIKTLVQAVNDYTGPEIPDDGYTIKLDNGDNATFHFAVAEPQNTNQQTFFLYKLEVSQQSAHEHDYSDEWESDEDNHWHECECGDKTDKGEHEGNTADCVTPSICDECGKQLSDVDENNHTGNTEIRNAKEATEFEDGYTGDIHCADCGKLLESGTVIPATHKHDYSDEWESDEDNHWHECECGDKTDKAEHEGNTADCVTPSICDECGKELAGKDSENHTGNTEIRNTKEATEFEDGYTGDIHCADCGKLLESGTVIPATHKHDYSDEWESDEDGHWHECECGDKTDVGTHNGNTPDCVNPSICEECEKQLADKDKTNHTGGTVVKNEKPASEFEEGYSGDIHCAGCDELLEKGEVLPATHQHDHSKDWSSNETEHWHECACGDKKDVAEHNGNTPNCTTPSICEECEKQLADKDKTNHTGGTVVKNEKPASEFEEGYSGDIHCAGCDELLEKGEVLPATHQHDHSNKWSSNETEHWHECACGDKTDVGTHNGNTPNCTTPSICEECEKQLAEKDKTNHTGGTVVKNEKPASEFEEGYSGDIHCAGCDELLEKGEVLPVTHKHDYSDEWESDEEGHWHECECGDKTDKAEHEGNTADCSNPSICDECGKQLSDVDKNNHTGNTEIRNAKEATEFEDGYTGDTHCADCGELLENGTVIPATHEHDYSDEWTSDEDSHWHECECGDKTDKAEHEGNTADCSNPSICDECGKQLSDVDKNNHTGNTEIRNAKEATEFEDGYTGDTHCADCGKLLESGTVIPATHKHDYSDEWESDEEGHWHECECGDKTDKAEHEGNTADCSNPSICDECGKQLSDVDKNNHTGNTEIRNAKEATEFEDGYTGDTHCADCGELLENGTVIPATHKHDYSDEWESDEDNHWHECECGDKQDSAAHEFVWGSCSVCGEPYSFKSDDLEDAFDSVIDMIIGTGSGLDFGSIDLGDIDLGDIDLGDINLGDIDLGDIDLGDIDLGDITIGGISLGDLIPGIGSGSGNGTGSDSDSDKDNATSSDTSTGNQQNGSSGSTADKDDSTVSPDTGSGSALGLVLAVMLMSSLGLAVIKRKESIA